MTRAELLQRLEDSSQPWDMIVIGGGATGLGTAVEAASRGYRTLLLERHDFAKGTSSRSTKLIHGGVRYLQQGNVALVHQTLRERGLLLANAPHLVHGLSFVVPLYDWWEGPFYGAGLMLYDTLAGSRGLGPASFLSREQTIGQLPTINPEGLRGGVVYYDAQFDDARLAVTLARTVADLGGTPLNYLQVTGLLKSGGLTAGVSARDVDTGREYELKARVVINATGVFTDAVRQLDDPEAEPVIAPSQGAHLVLHRSFLPGASALIIPRTADNRVLFAIPWQGRVLVGTTDTSLDTVSLEPRPLAEEIDFLLASCSRYLTRNPTRADILCAFAGLRPLAHPGTTTHTARLSREHDILVSSSRLVTVVGGKWTTYRRMGEDTVRRAASVAGIGGRPSVSKRLRLHGWQEQTAPDHRWGFYGTDGEEVIKIATGHPSWIQLLHPGLPCRPCDVVWGVRREWARTVEDVLARRTRALFLDARASMTIAPAVAELMAGELGHDEAWQRAQVSAYCELAAGYLQA